MSARSHRARSRAVAALAVAALAASLAGCGDAGERPRRGPGAAVWATPAALAALDAAALDDLRAAGVRELFLEAGTVSWAGATPRLAPDLAPAPRQLPATLVVAGAWPPAAAAEADAPGVAARLAEQLAALALAAEGQGWLPVGFHLQPPAGGGDLRALAAVAPELAGLLGQALLSVGLDRHQLADEQARGVAQGVDFVVSVLYGQPPGEREEAAAWRLDEVADGVRRLEALEVDYLVGVVTVGGATVADRRGGGAATSRASLARLVAHPGLALSRDLSLEGWDRRVVTFETDKRIRVGDLELQPGQKLRAARLALVDLLALGRRLGAMDLEHRLGELYYRLPVPGEGLSLGAGGLAAAARGEQTPPRLEVTAERLGGGRALRIELTNRGDEATNVAFLDHNYVEVAVPGGVVTDVDPGRFRRYAVLAGGREAATMAEFRSADGVRLFVTAVDAGETVATGPIAIRGGGPVTIGGRFLLVDGSVYDLPPQAVP
jgi:hypothetical protein